MSETTKINSDMASSGQKHKSAGKKIVLIAVCVVIAAAIAGFLLFRDTVRLMTIRTAPDMFKFLATAKTGDISDPLDLDDGIGIVGVLDRSPGEPPDDTIWATC